MARRLKICGLIFEWVMYCCVTSPYATSGIMAPTWYVLRSKPNKEEFFWGQLIAHFIEVYYPCIRAKAINPRAYKDKPYLPGHLFIHVDLQELPPSFLEGLPGSRGLITDGDLPIAVPETLIAAIRRRVDQINATVSPAILSLPTGQAFAIQDCPSTGFETIFDGCLSGNERVHRLHCLLRGERLPVELPGFELNL